MAGVGGLELRNVVVKYPFERSQISGDPVEFRPQRLFAFELRRWVNYRYCACIFVEIMSRLPTLARMIFCSVVMVSSNARFAVGTRTPVSS